MSTVTQVHSKLGASSAERWMNCPGSNVILTTLGIDTDTEESSYAAEGTAAHEAAAYCLREHHDGWEIVGQEFYGHKVDEEMANAIDYYAAYINVIDHGYHKEGSKTFYEHRITADFDELFYGTVDCAIVSKDRIDILDFKYGKGIAVEPDNNPQLMYYAVGFITQFNLTDVPVFLHIVQPRAFHVDGPVRVWETSSAQLLDWRDKELIPAMKAARIDSKLLPGEHCRFCPSKLACPVLNGMFKVAATADASTAKQLTDEQLALEYEQIDAVKHYLTGLEREVLRRLSLGHKVEAGEPRNTFKLVYKKANRVLKDEGAKAIEAGEAPFKKEEAYESKLKSVAGLEAIGPKAKAWVKEYAYTPQKDLTVAPATDKRVAVTVSKPEDNFGDLV